MELNLQATFQDGIEKVISTGAPEIVAFEREFDKPITTMQESPRYTYLVFMAWHSESRNKSTALKFEDWTNTIAGIEVAEEKK